MLYVNKKRPLYLLAIGCIICVSSFYTKDIQAQDIPQAPPQQQYDNTETFNEVLQPLLSVGGQSWLLDQLLYNMRLTEDNVTRLRNWHDMIQQQANYYDPFGEITLLAEQVESNAETASQLISYRNFMEQQLSENPTKPEVYRHLRTFFTQHNIDQMDAAELIGYISPKLGTTYLPYPGFSERAMQLIPRISSITDLPQNLNEFSAMYEDHMLAKARNTFERSFVTHIASRRQGYQPSEPTPQTHYIDSNLSPAIVYQAMDQALRSALHAIENMAARQGGTISISERNRMVYHLLEAYLPSGLHTIAQQYNITGSNTMAIAENIRTRLIQYLTIVNTQRLSETTLQFALTMLSRQPDGPYQALLQVSGGATSQQETQLRREQMNIELNNLPEAPTAPTEDETISTTTIQNVINQLDNTRLSHAVYDAGDRQRASVTIIVQEDSILTRLQNWRNYLQSLQGRNLPYNVSRDIARYLEVISETLNRYEEPYYITDLPEPPQFRRLNPSVIQDAIQTLDNSSISLRIDNPLLLRNMIPQSQEAYDRLYEWYTYFNSIIEAIENDRLALQHRIHKIYNYRARINTIIQRYEQQNDTATETPE